MIDSDSKGPVVPGRFYFFPFFLTDPFFFLAGAAEDPAPGQLMPLDGKKSWRRTRGGQGSVERRLVVARQAELANLDTVAGPYVQVGDKGRWRGRRGGGFLGAFLLDASLLLFRRLRT